MKLTIRTKLIATCGVLLLLLAVTAGLGIHELETSNEDLHQIVRGPSAAALLASTDGFSQDADRATFSP